MKSLFERIHEAMMIGPLISLDERLYNTFKDYLAQHFQAAMLANPESEKVLKDLFDKIVKKK